MDMGMPTLANMILLGALIAKTGCVREESLADALHKVIPARKADLFDLNMQALQAGKGVRRMKTSLRPDGHALRAAGGELREGEARSSATAMAERTGRGCPAGDVEHRVFPEASDLAELADRDCARVKRELGALAAELGVNLVAGSVANARGGQVYNTGVRL